MTDSTSDQTPNDALQQDTAPSSRPATYSRPIQIPPKIQGPVDKEPVLAEPTEIKTFAQQTIELKDKTNKAVKHNRWLILMAFGLFLIVGALIMVYSFLFSRTFFTVKVVDQNTQKALPGVGVIINKEKKITDPFGKARFDDLKPGNYTITVTMEGYSDVKEKVTLKNGNNGEHAIALDLVLVKVSGKVYDYITKLPMPDVSVTIDDKTVKSDAKGDYSLTDILPGKRTVSFKKDSFLNTDVEITGNYDTTMDDVFMCADSKLIFVSNRDGNKAVYMGYANGNGVKKLWNNIKDFDDFNASLSPDKKYVAFLSNREGKEGSDGNYLSAIYINNIDGLALRKVSETQTSVEWLDDSTGFVFLGEDTKKKSDLIKLFTLETKKVSDVTTSDYKTFILKTNATPAQFNNLRVASQNRLVFRVNNNEDLSKEGLYISSTDGKTITKLTPLVPYAYSLNKAKDALQFTYQQGSSSIRYEVNLNTGEQKEVAFEHRNGQLVNDYYLYEEKTTPDNKLKAYIDYRDGKNDLYVSNTDGSGERRLSYIGGVSDFEFIHDGQYLVFFVSKADETTLYVVGLADKNQPIKVTDVSEFTGVIEP